nr:IclR family transcriptional regulator [Lactobacillus pasteurii]
MILDSTKVKPYGTVLIKQKEILDFLLSYEGAPTLADISKGLGRPKPTLLKILNTMELIGFVRKNGDTKQYSLGISLIPYAQKAISSFDIVEAASPYLRKLRDLTQETVNLGVIRDNKIVLIQKLESPQSIKMQSQIGGTMRLYSSAMGKASLATYSQSKLIHYFNNESFDAITTQTITNPQILTDELRIVQRDGYAVDDEENERDVFCIGAALYKNGHLYGAFSISTPKYRLSDERKREFIDLLKKTQLSILETI